MCANHTHSHTHAGQAQSRQHSGNTSEGFRSSGLEHELLPCWDREFWDQVVDRPEDTNVARKAVNQRYTKHGVFAARHPQCHPGDGQCPAELSPLPRSSSTPTTHSLPTESQQDHSAPSVEGRCATARAQREEGTQEHHGGGAFIHKPAFLKRFRVSQW